VLKKYPDFEGSLKVIGNDTLRQMAWYCIVTMSLFCTVSEIFNIEWLMACPWNLG